VRYLQKRLGECTIVERAPDDTTRVFFGAWVRLEDDAGCETRYRIVGSDEFDREPGFISVDAPLARALLRKTAGDECVVALPQGQAVYTVLEVRYRCFDDTD
jgi:transcription elongation factor GreB